MRSLKMLEGTVYFLSASARINTLQERATFGRPPYARQNNPIKAALGRPPNQCSQAHHSPTSTLGAWLNRFWLGFDTNWHPSAPFLTTFVHSSHIEPIWLQRTPFAVPRGYFWDSISFRIQYALFATLLGVKQPSRRSTEFNGIPWRPPAAGTGKGLVRQRRTKRNLNTNVFC